MLIFPTEEAFDVKALIDSEEQAYRDQIDLAVKSILDKSITPINIIHYIIIISL